MFKNACSARPKLIMRLAGRNRLFGEWSVQGVREHGKSPRTPLAAFFNISIKGLL